MRISIDLGDTLFNRRSPIEVVPGLRRYPLFPMAEGVLRGWRGGGHTLSVISKIDRGQEARVSWALCSSGLMPDPIDPRDVRFCYARDEKGPIAAEIGAEVQVDDRAEALAACGVAGVRHLILFTGGHDDREGEGKEIVLPSGVHVAASWEEVARIVRGLR